MQISPPIFKILVLAPFDNRTTQPWDGPPVAVELAELDRVIADLSVHYDLTLEANLCPAGGLSMPLKSLKAFHPDGLIADQPYLAAVAAAREALEAACREGKSKTEISVVLSQWPELPAIELPEPAASSGRSESAEGLDNLLAMVAVPDQKATPVKSGENPFSDILGSIFKTLFHQPEFKQMEASWRGLKLLLQQGRLADNVMVEIAPVHPDTLEKTLESLTPAILGDLPGLILIDMPLSNTPSSSALLSVIANWASDLMVPVAVSASSRFLQIESWDDLKKLPFIPTHLEKPEYAKFRTIRSSAEAQWLSVLCNRFLLRYPYGKDNKPRRISFTEKDHLWLSPVWACGTVVAMSVSKTGWPTRLCDKQSYAVEDLAFASETSADCTETFFSRERMDQLLQAGLTPLISEKKRDRAFFHQAKTLAGGSLAYQLLLSQVTRFVLWCKDHLPDERDPAMLETQLKLAFQVFSEQSSPSGFESVALSTGKPDGEGRIPLHIKIVPAASVLSTRQAVEMTLNW